MNTKIAGKGLLLFFGLFAVVLDIVQAQSWQNLYVAQLTVNCEDTSAFYRVRSQHSNGARDRQWLWECRGVVDTAFDDCQWTDYLNSLDQPIYFQCDHNYVLTGVNSYYYHDNGAGDRRWKAKCCKSSDHFVQDCRVSGYVNTYDSYMDFSVDSPEVFTGFFNSYMHSLG